MVQVIVKAGTGVVPSPRDKVRQVSQDTLGTVLAHLLGVVDNAVASDVEILIASVGYSTGTGALINCFTGLRGYCDTYSLCCLTLKAGLEPRPGMMISVVL